MEAFPTLNAGFQSTFRSGELSLGLTVPIEAQGANPVPSLERHVERVQLAEELGFAAVWLRDVPFNVPSFGDAGQTFDPFVYLGTLAASTQRIALGVASVILPIRHPAHVAKAAASVDVLSKGRLLLGVASGDRPQEYPAMNMGSHDRGHRFREAFQYLRALAAPYPTFDNEMGVLDGTIDMLPKPFGTRIPLLVTGGSQQPPEWVAEHSDGWITYPRDPIRQAETVRRYRACAAALGHRPKPVVQSLYVDLLEDEDAPPKPIHLGFQSGANALRAYLEKIQLCGVNHVAINLRFSSDDTESALHRIAKEILPAFR
ncbi:MAG: LLM class oxidoreductase [Myxococcota bacterium]